MNAFEKLITETGKQYTEFSELAGIDVRYLKYIRDGKRSPKLEVVGRMAKILKMPKGDLFEVISKIRERKSK